MPGDPTLSGSKCCLLKMGVARLLVGATPGTKAGRIENPTLPVNKLAGGWRWGVQVSGFLVFLDPSYEGQRIQHCLGLK